MDYLFLLYLGDVVEGISHTLGVLSLLGIVGAAAGQFILAMIRSGTYGEEDVKRVEGWQIKLLRWTAIPIICLIVSMFIPSKQFIYTAVVLQAGAEITQEIKDNPLVAKGFMVLEKYLDNELSNSSNTE